MLIKLSDERLRPLTDEQLERCSRQDLLVIARTERHIRMTLEGYVHELEEKVVKIEGQFFRIRSKVFSPKSEKSPKPRRTRKGPIKTKSKTKKLPSERYPNAEIIEKHITYEQPPVCPCCSSQMADSGMMETSEYLTVIPKKYIIVRQQRHKYRCQSCHGSVATTPSIPRVVPGSSYSDELCVDATLSKYCDLIPMERYCQMAKRQGLEGLPPHSLIALTFKLAEFLKDHYLRLRQETLNTSVLLADETPHRMLEGDEKTKWFLWGFLSGSSCFYECHDNRSGDVAISVLRESNCDVLLTDVYSGYKRAVKETNAHRETQNLPAILMAFCNSHARREFKIQADPPPAETEYMVERYKEIYKLESNAKADGTLEALSLAREKMRPIFENMRAHAEANVTAFSDKSIMAKAFNYFLNNYQGLTLCLNNPNIPLDNNASERMLRSHVVGRKTWYGTHSKEAAEVAAIHFSLIESCKLNTVNPRSYYLEMITRKHSGEIALTPKEFAEIKRKPMDSC